MRLERLEISGFKSFSDRSELAFDRGVTAIVGPNGCGKSNVADALTWVMGEQSAKSLRGEKMEDVIFSGSDARKPTGAAEVRLRFSGVAMADSVFPGATGDLDSGGSMPSDAHVADILDAVREVEVTRRLYRSGESEYLIDGHSCRLKDVHELLMDTGLGAKAYAIIEQGKIGLILSSRPTDRRQLIEEAAGITKYKSRRRAAELKLEAAQQNLTRIDDIVFEVEKQRGSLKRQAAKARRYTRLRDEMRRWEKVLFARRYRLLGEVIESARARLAETREQEAGAAGRLAEVENELARLRIELAEAESAAARVREAAHARELEINRREQQIALDAQQSDMLQARSSELEIERVTLDGRREPERIALANRRAAALDAERAREESAAVVATAAAEHARAQQAIEAAEQDVDQARSEVYAVMNTLTALTAALEAATAQRERSAEALGRLEMEASDLRTEHERAAAARSTAAAALTQGHDALDATKIARGARESELASARIEHEWRAREVRSREHELASLTARLRSLEELDAHRAGFSDAARMVLVQANGRVGQMGAVADVIEVEPRYERAVESCLGELLQHVLVERHEHAAAGLALVREQDAGRCGFVVTGDGVGDAMGALGAGIDIPSGAVMLSSVIRVDSQREAALRAAIGEAVIVDSFDLARELAATLPLPVATLDGDVLRGTHLVAGGGKVESRGILATKREIKELRERVSLERDALERLASETAQFEQTIAHATGAVNALAAELHRQEKAIVSVEAQVQRATEDEARLGQRSELVAAETGRARDEIAALDGRQTEARESIARLDEQRRGAETMLSDAQRVLFTARETSETLAQNAAEARANHAALIERSSAIAADVRRMEEAARELEKRVETCATDLTLMRDQRERLLAAVAEGHRLVDDDIKLLNGLRDNMRDADEKAMTLKSSTEQQEEIIRDARRALDAVRSLAAELEITRAKAEADLGHLAQQCLDAVNLPLDDVTSEVEQMEAAGDIEPDVNAIRAAEAPDPDEADEDGGMTEAVSEESSGAPVKMTAEEAITELRGKIDKLGPVNMMAIEQFAELDTRHTFLTTQRTDLVDSIAQTNEAIKRIDETTHARFREAFTAINTNFQGTFATLFGGGKAGITLLDDSDPLESGIDIVASPPGKRLQSVMLLSGGEKALTAIALMFAIFKYKPSPFCLLDEIDAPLDDANIGRFVEMLRSMLEHTQFIVITHNRKTMEIANRLYGVTMEEPGVSKLISIQLN
ncbi:MAG TPA: chromosome segregation protein SMC [Vicinamibacterales bacterium]|nr:chromosome segregation protein SMC [Vicinamibacterales bacterium]